MQVVVGVGVLPHTAALALTEHAAAQSGRACDVGDVRVQCGIQV